MDLARHCRLLVMGVGFVGEKPDPVAVLWPLREGSGVLSHNGLHPSFLSHSRQLPVLSLTDGRVVTARYQEIGSTVFRDGKDRYYQTDT